jgi:hypothetical protein
MSCKLLKRGTAAGVVGASTARTEDGNEEEGGRTESSRRKAVPAGTTAERSEAALPAGTAPANEGGQPTTTVEDERPQQLTHPDDTRSRAGDGGSAAMRHGGAGV